MPRKIDDLTTLTNYTVPALKRALHHAQNITEIVPVVIGCIVLYADPTSLMGRGNGSTTAGNMGWINSLATGRQYAVVYAHKSQSIEVRDRTQQGTVLYSFTNTTANRDIIRAFASL